ncbi:hypothetical protein TMatcc_010482 [Talaromyces marneffei ATCC 18224]
MPSEAVVWMRRAPLPGFSMVMLTRTGNPGISPSKSRPKFRALKSDTYLPRAVRKEGLDSGSRFFQFSRTLFVAEFIG